MSEPQINYDFWINMIVETPKLGVSTYIIDIISVYTQQNVSLRGGI